MNIEDAKTMTVKELCDAYGASRSTVYRWCKKHNITPLKKRFQFTDEQLKKISAAAKKSLSPEQLEYIKLNINEISQNQIARDLEISQYLVSVAIKEMGLEVDQEAIDRFKADGSKRGLPNALSRSIKRWEDPEFRNYMSSLISERNNQLNLDPDYKQRLSDSSKKMWQKHAKKMLEIFASREYRNKISESNIAKWKDPEYREKHRKLWSDPAWLAKVTAHLDSPSIVSSLQRKLYSILDDLGVQYYRERQDGSDPETIVGPYHFDCVILHNHKKFLIECQGDYWHAINKNIRNDRAKATYIERYHKDCEIKYLWEHEFKCPNKIVELIKYWLGISKIQVVDFSFADVAIVSCEAKDYKPILSKYHYLPNAGRGGIAYGAYLGEKLIAVCVFSPLVRQNLPCNTKTTRELSRLCIHPKYQKKNFASWFVSRCIKNLPQKYTKIISYCDTTFNHDGATYKACNFKLDGEVKPDYWYVSEDGWVMHKKTLYNHARSLGLKEKDFAKEHGYRKVHGEKKLRFVFERKP